MIAKQQKAKGRPRLAAAAAEDDATAKKRARLRDAQHAFRARKDAKTTELQQRVDLLQSVIDGMSSNIASITDDLVRNGVLTKNPAFAHSYDATMRRVVDLAKTAEDDSSDAPEPAATSATAEQEEQLAPTVPVISRPRKASPARQLAPQQRSMSPRLGFAAFPTSVNPLRTHLHSTFSGHYTGPDSPFYSFCPQARYILPALCAGQDSFHARLFWHTAYSTYQGFIKGDQAMARGFFRFEPHLYDPASVARGIVTEMQIVLFGSNEDESRSSFSFPDLDRTRPQTQYTVELDAARRACCVTGYEIMKQRELLRNAGINLSGEESYTSETMNETFVPMGHLIDYLNDNWAISITGPERLKVRLPDDSRIIEEDFGFEDLLEVPDATFDPPIEPPTAGPSKAAFEFATPESRNSSHWSTGYVDSRPTSEVVINTQSLIEDLWSCTVWADNKVRLERAQLDLAARNVIARAQIAKQMSAFPTCVGACG